MNLYEETKFLMDKYNIKANKNLGQNFLVDENVIETAIEKSNINEDDLVIEIGPGLGTLTKYLLENAGRVICVELDKRMIKILEESPFLLRIPSEESVEISTVLYAATGNEKYLDIIKWICPHTNR